MGDTYLSFFIILHSIFLGLFMVDLSKKIALGLDFNKIFH